MTRMAGGSGAGEGGVDSGDMDVRVAQLQQRVIGIEASIQNVATQVSNLASTLNERSRTPWGVLASVASVVVVVIAGIGTLAWQPLRDDISEIKTAMGGIVPASQFQEFKNTYENNRLTYRVDNEAKMKGIEEQQRRDITRIDDELKGVVPRAEHERVWANYDQRFIDQQRQIDEVKAAQSATYGVRDVILDYRDRLDRLERERGAASR